MTANKKAIQPCAKGAGSSCKFIKMELILQNELSHVFLKNYCREESKVHFALRYNV